MVKTSGFTFVEIIVVVTIMALMSTSGFFYFANYLGQKKIDAHVQRLELELDEMDYQVARREISSYSIDFTSDYGYTYSLNSHTDPLSYYVNSDFSTGSFTLSNTATDDSTWNIKVYADGKIADNILLPSDTPATLSLAVKRDYTLVSYFTGTLANTLGARYFTLDNLEDEEDNKVFLETINSLADKSGTDYTTVRLENKGGNKKITSSGVELTEVTLFFSQGGYEALLPLKK